MSRRMRKFTLTNPPVVTLLITFACWDSRHQDSGRVGARTSVGGCRSGTVPRTWWRICTSPDPPFSYVFAVRRSTFPRMLYLEVFCFAPLSYLGIQLTFETKESENMDKRPETCL
jgi:hypothetical protein